jgi:glycosyltransferase involved in cell wall biosynthesis
VCLDAFVLPSAYDTWGLVLNEAMLFGLPVVASRTAGAALDLVEEGQNGYVYDAGDVAALAAALRRLAVSADLRLRFGRRSEQIVQEYSYDTCIESIVRCLQQITARHPEADADARHEPGA